MKSNGLQKCIYHGTVQKGLELIKPFKRYTPGGEDIADSIPARIYATYEPAYAIAHSFPWSSDDGLDIQIEDGIITIIVPRNKQSVLNQEVCVYTLSDDTFTVTTEEDMGLTYHSESEITPIHCECFSSVTEAMEKFGGKIRFV